eukprot:TRINITY_DN2110_c0_g1_i4.p1 TRINITY_DN2110_c0_g1~~TRINITY_DN2110_c0_g1_i4.p1  ORF type:complete len:193 (-),score=32.66 TRINITY_DN2110_c0_g1_i4:135-713(-)
MCLSHVPVSQDAKPCFSSHTHASCTVDGLVSAAESAAAQACSKAAKRRIRQRLHKKLSSILSGKQLQETMEKFKDDLAAPVAVQSHEQQVKPIQRVPFLGRFVAIPIMQIPISQDTSLSGIPLMFSRPGQNLQSPCKPASISEKHDDMKSFMKDSREIVGCGTWAPTEFPVERTFIHFRVAGATARKRASSF